MQLSHDHGKKGKLLAAIAAEGIDFEPDFIVSPLIKAGRLTPILKHYQPPPFPIYAIYPSRRHLSAKVRSFVDFLVERFADKRDWS